MHYQICQSSHTKRMQISDLTSIQTDTLKVTVSLPCWVPTEPVFLQSFDVVSHERKLIVSKMIKVIPCEDSRFMQVIKKQSTLIMRNNCMTIQLEKLLKNGLSMFVEL